MAKVEKHSRYYASSKQWNEKHPGYMAQKVKEYRHKQKAEAYKILGSCCKCCGENTIPFLTIDHVNNDGFKDKQKVRNPTNRAYLEVVKNIFPGKYQLLCWNCNNGKYLNNGICPHKELSKWNH